mgnify:CR=1 FL=1
MNERKRAALVTGSTDILIFTAAMILGIDFSLISARPGQA